MCTSFLARIALSLSLLFVSTSVLAQPVPDAGVADGPSEAPLNIDLYRILFNPQRDFATAIFYAGAVTVPPAATLRVTNLRNRSKRSQAFASDGSAVLNLPGFDNTAWSGRTRFQITILDAGGQVLAEAVFDTGSSWVVARRASDIGLSFTTP